jgi:4,5-DOPA dioxygenase extradiol
MSRLLPIRPRAAGCLMNTARQPVLFLGHGSPLNAIQDNRWSQALRQLAPELGRPRAILVVSAHYYEPGSRITAQAQPATIHDFGGFPPELHRLQYPAPGDPTLAARIAAASDGHIRPSSDWGLDHGSWSLLVHLFPAADIPVLELSLDSRASAQQHLALGARLAPLRDEGVLIIGSGNIVHNLGHAFRAWRNGDRETPDWAQRFDSAIETALASNQREAVAEVFDGPDGRMAHPTPEHFLPLLYAVGASDADDAVDFPIAGFDMGSLSMRSVRFQPRH